MTQMHQVFGALDMKEQIRPFTVCLECNEPLAETTRDEIEDRVPPYVFKTQTQYMECRACRRIYWRGTHWEAIIKKLEVLADYQGDYHEEVIQ